MQQFYSMYKRIALCTLLLTLMFFARSVAAQEQADVDNFNRTAGNTVGGSWTETETAAGGASLVGNELSLQRPAAVVGRQFVSKATPGTYSTTLDQNNCTLTWAFNMRQTRTNPSGFDGADYGLAVALAASASDLTTGTGYAVVLGQGGATDALRLVSYSGGLDLNSNLTNIITVGDFADNYMDVRVTYVPSTNTWSLFYRDNGINNFLGQQASFGDPLTASTAGGSAVNSTFTGTALGFIGCLWNHNTAAADFARLDNFYVPSGRPTLPVITPSGSTTICNGGSVGLTAAASTTSRVRNTFNSAGGPSTVTNGAAQNGSVYPWTINVSGIPTSGVTIESVTLNGVTHEFPDDLDILLQSPIGTNVILMSDAGDTDDITGRTLTIMDGSPAMTDNPPFGSTLASGLYSPTNYGTPDDFPTAPGPGNGFVQATPTLSLFTGNYNGDWDLLIRDDANGDLGQVGSWSITFTYAATASYLWAPLFPAANGVPLPGTTAGVTVAPTTTQVYTVTAGHNANACSQSQTVTVTVVNPPTTATVGGAQTICATGTTLGLGGNTETVGTGLWTVVSGGTGTFSDDGDPNSTFTHTGGAGPVVLRWTMSNTPCSSSFAEVSITITQPPTTATVGGAQTICANGTTTGLGANAETVGTGAWTVQSGGTGTFSGSGDPSSTFTHTGGAGPVVLRWTMSNAPCPSSFDDVTITITQPPTTATVGGPQTICANGTTTGLGANAETVGTGAWTVQSGGTGTFSGSGDPSSTFTHTGGAGPVVLRWTMSNAPCPSSFAEVSIAITPATTVSDAGTDQNICSQPGTTALAANTPVNGTGTWTQQSGPVSATIVTPGSETTSITGMTSPGAYVFRWTITNAPCAPTQDEVTVNAGVCVYYSRATGTVASPIWSDTPSGPAGPATFTSSTSMVVQSPDVVTNTSNVQVNDLTVNTGGTLILNAFVFTVNGTSAAFNGSLTANDNSTLALAGTGAASLSVAGTKMFYNLTVSDAAGVTATGAIDLRGTLLLNAGNFNASAATVRLRSLSTGTARLGPVDPSASYTGNMIVDRRIPGGATNWRMLGSPVVGRTVADWQDDFLTAGYPGSQYPTFDDPVGSGNLWPSIRWYDEPDPGPADIDGVEGVSSSAQALTMGQGFAVWCGDMLGGTNPFLIDLVGAPNIASSPIALPMSWTNNGAGSDGWNLVSNPVPSPILFSAISRGADVDDYVTYYDPSNGNTATYQIGVGGVNGGTDVIQGSQGFFLKATGSAVATTVEESDKTSGNGGGFFGGDEETTLSALRLKVTSGINTYADETMVVFDLGTPELDGSDALKYVFAHPAAPQVATIAPTGELFAINAYGAFTNAISIPVMVNAAVSGTYTVTATGVASLGLTCVTLEDLITGDVTPLTEGASYSFAMSADDDATAPRLMVHATVPMAFEATDATCGGMANGQATVSVAGGPLDVTWTDLVGTVLLQQNAVTGDATFGGLAAGSYMVHVGTNTACGELVSEFTIDAPFVLDGATVASTPTTCADSEDGSIDVMVMGGVEPYTYTWSNGSDAQDLVAGAGNYTLTVTDANDCEWSSDVFTIDAGGAQAGFNVMGGTLLVNTDVLFTNTSTPDAEYFWEFGDGGTSTDVDGVHAYELPGTYTVTLTVTSGGCTDVSTFDVTVEMNTGISTIAVVGTNAWTSPNGFVVEHNFTEPVLIEVLDATGRLQATRQAPGTPGRVVLSHEGLSTGIWFVRVTSGTAQQTFRLPLLR